MTQEVFFLTTICRKKSRNQSPSVACDAFRVIFLYGLLKSETVETAAELANAVAALKGREIGARTSLPEIQELKEIFRK